MLNELAEQLHETAASKGFWDKPREPSEVLLLIVSELVEAMEEYRAGHLLDESRVSYISTPDSKPIEVTMVGGSTFLYYNTPAIREITPKDWVNHGFMAKPKGVPSELADVIIRTLEACHAWGIDIDAAVRLKSEYNKSRGHMHGGKKF